MPLATATTTAAASLVSIVGLLAPVGHPRRDLLLEAVGRGFVVGAALCLGRTVGLLDPAPRVVVRIVVTSTVADLGGSVVARAAQVRRDLTGGAVADVFQR